METNQKVKLALTIACFAAVSIFATTHYRRRRRQKSSFQNLCYLETESKPQSAFKRVLADNSYTPFNHLIRNQEEPSHLHPYKEEITALLENSQLESFCFVDGEVDLEMKGSHVWVDTEDQLVKLVEILSKETVFGVDTEQHSLRSFLGFTALIQISTQKEDYLVDTIALHDVMTLLHPVFSDPSICKVFHGADNDVLWLQRDFHIYVVNLFDTAKACEVLSKPHKSLAYLLETYCGVATNKMLQVFIHGVGDDDACSPSVISLEEIIIFFHSKYCNCKREDWRLRPLSEEMVHYARGDAHYLLYIANCLINELKKLDNDCLDDKLHFLLEASRRSNMICLQLYTKEVEVSPGDSAASSIISRFLNGQGGLPLTCETKELVGRLCMWRDLMARVHDESLRYVLSDQAIAALSSKVPTTTKETYDTISEADLNLDSLSVFLPTPSAVVYSHLEDVHHLLRDKISNQNDAFVKLLQKHLGRNGSCPVSIYNYSLLSKSTLKLIDGSTVKKNGSKAARRIGKKASRELFVQKFSCKAPVYHNCRIYASDGRLLCYCDRRKLEWYLRRNLAKLVDSDPLAVMLLFEPKGRPEDEDNDFYIQSKKNMCVGCGERNHYLRYRIIPSCYRVHFPEHLKSHRSHDIVLLCVDCHEIAHSAAEKHKRQIAGEYGIPLFVKKVTDSSQTEIMPRTSASVESFEEAGVSPLQLRTAAMALMRHGPRMPTKRREELTEIVMKFFGGREVSQEDLERALLVGMSPHERRRLEKKRGLSFKHSSGSLLLSKDSENNADSMSISGLSETLDDDVMNDLQTVEEANCCKQESQNACQEMHNGGSNGSVCSESEINDKSSATDTEDLKLDIERISGGKIVVDTDEDHERRRLPDEICDSYSCGVNGTGPHKHNQKLSLLGHGPHGKQVVDHLLKEYGEDGVNQFCQRWRQVFVEAIHPRFLPSGWDVMHSGRRNFGEYSVFNPTKKDTPTASD